jgi:uncharacterized protein (TIGR03084 family)
VAQDLLADLAAEYDELDALLAGLDADAWDLATPAVGFAVRDEVYHLAFSEELAALAAGDPGAFGARLLSLMGDLADTERQFAENARAMDAGALLAYWRDQRRRTLAALRAHDPGDRIPWVAGDMSVRSFATARLMETWAHGQDVYDALGRTRHPTPRLRHVADLGVRTRRFSYRNRGLEPPAGDVRVELDGPDGSTWTWGSEDATDRITGPAADFCLVVTQRRHADDTALHADGPLAKEWLTIAQAFAGPPTDGRRPAGRR